MNLIKLCTDSNKISMESIIYDGMLFLKDEEGTLFTTEMVYAGIVLKTGRIFINDYWLFWESEKYRKKVE